MTDTTRYGAKCCTRCGRWTDHHASNCPLPNPKEYKPDPKQPTHLGWPFPKRSEK